MFAFQLGNKDPFICVELIGDLDIEATETIENEILPALSRFELLVFDFNQVPFVDSTGIGLLIHLIDTLSSNGHPTMKIINVQPLVQDVFDMIQLQEILGEKVLMNG